MSGIRWTAVPARRLGGRELNWRVNAVLSLAALAALAGPVALLLSLRTPPVVEPPHQVDRVAALAEQVAIDFLSGQYTRVPTAVGVDPTFGAPRSAAGQLDTSYFRAPLAFVASTQVVGREQLRYGDRPYELVTVAAFGVGGDTWWVSVPVYPEGPYLAATPTLVPPPRVAPPSLPALDYRGDSSQVVAPPAVVALVAEWSSAWAADDRATLKRLTGDTAPGTYRGLAGFEAQRTVLVSAVAVGDPSSGGGAQRLIVRAAVWLRPPGADVWGQSVEMDLLIEDAASDLPKVTSWGPAGSVPLVSFLNREPVG
jgi:hypothetical protein